MSKTISKKINMNIDYSKIKVNPYKTTLINKAILRQASYFKHAAVVDVEDFVSHLHSDFRGWTFNKPYLADKTLIRERLVDLFKDYENYRKKVLFIPIYYSINKGLIHLFNVQKTFFYTKQGDKKLFVAIVGSYFWVVEEDELYLSHDAMANTLPKSAKEISYISIEGKLEKLYMENMKDV